MASNVSLVVGILGGLVGLGTAAVTIARALAAYQRQTEQLKTEIKALQAQTERLRSGIRDYQEPASTKTYDRLLQVSTEAAEAVRAEIHSISVPVPRDEPTDLKIILSTDPQASKVVGREFQITKGIAGWVYRTREPYYGKELRSDDRYFSLVDRAAGTQTGEGAMLALPLVVGERCLGVIQYMKSPGSAFDEEDVRTASRWGPALGRLLIELGESQDEDIPSVPGGSEVIASVLFSDIRSFSELAGSIRLGAQVQLLNEYYSRLLPIALVRKGRLMEYVGDGLFVSFALDSPATSARGAVRAAIEMQREFGQIVQSWREFKFPVSSSNTHNIGVATGKVHNGLMGHPKDRREKLVGPSVNLAAHLCEAANEIGGGVLICQETAECIGNEFEVMPVNTSVGKCCQVAISTAKQASEV